MVQARVVRWGNSRGIRIPRPMLEQAGITEAVTLEVREGQIVIRPVGNHPREGWAESFRAMVAVGDDAALWPDDLVDEFDDGHPAW